MTNKEIFEEKMNDLADSINEKAGTSGAKNLDELKLAVDSIPTAGALPTLFAPVIDSAINRINSVTNNPLNGGFNATIVSAIDGEAVQIPLAITQELDGKILIATATAENFNPASTQCQLTYFGNSQVKLANYSGMYTRAGLFINFHATDPNKSGVKMIYNGTEYANPGTYTGFVLPFEISSDEINIRVKYGANATIPYFTLRLCDIPNGAPKWTTGISTGADYCSRANGSNAKLLVNGAEVMSATNSTDLITFRNIPVTADDLITFLFTVNYN